MRCRALPKTAATGVSRRDVDHGKFEALLAA
jgi:hypothetical protein